MRLTAILAVSRDGAIGSTLSPTGMPWPRLQRDLRRFREATLGRVCLVGRRTYDVLPRLPGRRLVVLTRRLGKNGLPQGVPVLCTPGTGGGALSPMAYARDTADALALYPGEDAMVIGGAEVYRALLPRCDRLLLTVAERDYPEADVRLDRPGALTDGLVCLAREYHQPDDANPVGVTFSEWVRP